MPNRTIYVRKEDVDLFDAIPDKGEWLHHAINNDIWQEGTLGSGNLTPAESNRLGEIEEKVRTDLESQENTPPSQRNKGEILDEIREIEALRDQELEYCQDNQIAKQITGRYQKQLDALWSEYNDIRSL